MPPALIGLGMASGPMPVQGTGLPMACPVCTKVCEGCWATAMAQWVRPQADLEADPEAEPGSGHAERPCCWPTT